MKNYLLHLEQISGLREVEDVFLLGCLTLLDVHGEVLFSVLWLCPFASPAFISSTAEAGYIFSEK